MKKLSSLHCIQYTLSFPRKVGRGRKQFSDALNPVFHELARIHDDYLLENTERGKLYDWTFWYKERPQVGFLGAAVWKSGGAALEEYGRAKQGYKKSGKSRKGRCDIWISLPPKNGEKPQWECEAKYKWIEWHESRRKWLNQYRKVRDAARMAAKDLSNTNDRLAVVFCTICASEECAGSEWLRDVERKVSSELGCGNGSRKKDSALLMLSLKSGFKVPEEAKKLRTPCVALLVTVEAI